MNIGIQAKAVQMFRRCVAVVVRNFPLDLFSRRPCEGRGQASCDLAKSATKHPKSLGSGLAVAPAKAGEERRNVWLFLMNNFGLLRNSSGRDRRFIRRHAMICGNLAFAAYPPPGRGLRRFYVHLIAVRRFSSEIKSLAGLPWIWCIA